MVVAVIGAGLAGLQCATDLVSAGTDVIVLEARDRVGGRVFSHHFDNGQTCERAAEFIDSDHTMVIALAAQLGLELTHRAGGDGLGDGCLLDAGGRAELVSLHASVAEDLARWRATLEQADEGEDTRSVADVLATLELSPLSRLVIGRQLRTEFMLPPAEIGLAFALLNSDGRRNRADVVREAHRVRGGNDQLASGLAERLGERVRLGVEVRHVDSHAGVVVFDDGTIEADAIVAAVPLPVLSRVWPDLPTELGSVGYGVGGKSSVQIQRRVWRDDGRSGSVLSDRGWGEMWETTDDQAGDSGVLTGLMASHDGAAFASMPEALDRLVAEMHRLFPATRGLAGQRVHTDWTNDPYSLGAYSCFGPGQLRDAASLLSPQPFGRLWLAGEHCAAAAGYAGFMEGALRSGRATAAALLSTK